MAAEPYVATRKEVLERRMAEVRRRTLALLDRVPEDFLRRRVHDFYSPAGWHFGHIGRTEEWWTVVETGLGQVRDEHLSFRFADRPDNPKEERGDIPDREGILAYLDDTRRASLEALVRADLSQPERLLKDGYAWEFAVQHECQHQESITELLVLIQSELPQPEVTPLREPVAVQPRWLPVPGNRYRMGSQAGDVYDNEREPHFVELHAFNLAREPVTAAEWLGFMHDRGYEREEFWTEEGWAWRSEKEVRAPEYWREVPGGWAILGPFGLRAMHPEEPAGSISHHEAVAFAKWAHARLPSEEEWEIAASAGGRRFPWGFDEPSHHHASFGLATPGPLPVKRLTAGPFGHLGLAGGLWEWTSTPFAPYPGFQPYPYPEYSEAHMDGRHFVCRGGSFASAGPILRTSFRNWYVPDYRQGFLGLRLARGG